MQTYEALISSSVDTVACIGLCSCEVPGRVVLGLARFKGTVRQSLCRWPLSHCIYRLFSYAAWQAIMLAVAHFRNGGQNKQQVLHRFAGSGPNF